MKNDTIKNLLIETAQKAGGFIKSNADNYGDKHFKGRVDIVTEVDLGAEKLILQAIKKNFPNHSIVTEESNNKETPSEYRWIIDPLDGTTNFVHSFPFVCVSIGIEFKGELIYGVVYNPFLGEFFYAESGKGAYLNDKPISVSSNKTLKASLLATGFPYELSKNFERNMTLFSKIYRQTQGIRRAGSAAMDLCYVACGRFDGFWEFDLNPWDVAAGALIVKEAGGKLSNFSGNELDIYSNEIMATNQHIHQKLLNNFDD